MPVGFQKTPPGRIRIELCKADDAGSSPGLCEDALGRLKDWRRGTLHLKQRVEGWNRLSVLSSSRASSVSLSHERSLGRARSDRRRKREPGWRGVSSRNSDGIHAGIYCPPGLVKTRLCVDGKAMLYAFCHEFGVPHKRCGKLLVAVNMGEVDKLAALKAQAEANGVTDLIWLSGKEPGALEPALVAERALLSPSTGIIDTHALMLALSGDAEAMVPCSRSKRPFSPDAPLSEGWSSKSAAPRPCGRRRYGRKRRGSRRSGARAFDRRHASR
jgi:FAD dependent oxidoreductase